MEFNFPIPAQMSSLLLKDKDKEKSKKKNPRNIDNIHKASNCNNRPIASSLALRPV
jgi:hypothetical protein